MRGVGKIGEGGGGVGNKTGGNVKDGGKVSRSYMLRMRGRAGTEKPSEGAWANKSEMGLPEGKSAVQLPCGYLLKLK